MSTENAELALPVETTVKAPIAGAKPAVELLKYGERGVELSSFEDLYRFSKAVILSGLAPKSFTKPEEVLITVQYGCELGLTPMSALQNISPINGRPTVWGDAVGGICSKTGLVEDTKQEMVGSIGSDDWGYKFTIKRKGRSEPYTAVFTVEKAKKAGLWGKAGPWQQYPDRMLLNRARTFCYRDAFPDAMKGMLTTEEAKDMPEEPKNVTRSLDSLDT